MIAAIVVAVLVGVAVRGRGAASDLWARDFESVDAAVLAQDASQIRHDLGLSPSGAVAALRYDCEIGRRDAARLLSHRSPLNPTLRRAYEATLHENWRLYAGCASALTTHASATDAVTVQLENQLAVLRHDESRVNVAARAVGYAPVFSSVR